MAGPTLAGYNGLPASFDNVVMELLSSDDGPSDPLPFTPLKRRLVLVAK